MRRWTPLMLCAFASAAAAAPPVGTESAVASVFAAFAQPGQPGCSVGVRRDGTLVHASGYGMADIAAGRVLDAQSVFNIASISKQFTALSVLLLEDRKALSLDDPLTKYIPELAATASGVTLRHLLHHMGGLRDYEALLRLKGRRYSDGATQFESIEILGRQRGVNFPPGTKYEYSNTGYVLLATVVERVSGQSMKQFAAENIFTPLDMRHTTIIDRYPADLPALARGYVPTKQGFAIEESAWEQVGDGQVHTTVGDLLLWTDNFTSARVGGPALMKRMVEVGVLASGEQIDYAAGVVIGEHRGLPTISHSGGWAGYRSNVLLFPEQRLAVAVFCNRFDQDPSAFSMAVAEIYLGDVMSGGGEKESAEAEADEDAPPPTRWRPADLAPYEGEYVSEEAQARCVLLRRADALVVEGCGEGVALRPTEPGEFFGTEEWPARLRFRESAGKPGGFTLHAYGLEGLEFTREQAP